MTDLSDNTGSSDLPVLLPDAAVEAMDDSKRAEAVCVPVEESKKAAREIEADFSKREHKIHRFPARARAVCVPVEELKKVAGEIEADFSKREQKIHRFPASVRPLLGRYIEPMCVAIGPYYSGLIHVQEMETVKEAAAHHFIEGATCSYEEIYEAFLPVEVEAQRLYTGNFDELQYIFRNHKLMMFRDACFLLQYMLSFASSSGSEEDHEVDPSLRRFLLANQPWIENDIMLLGNQLPWKMIDTLRGFMIRPVDVEGLIGGIGSSLQIDRDLKRKNFAVDIPSYSPPHLLSLLLDYKMGVPKPEDEVGSKTEVTIPTDGLRQVSIPISVSELARNGIKLIATSDATKLNNMRVKKGFLFDKLFIEPLALDSTRACWLVNMAAFELCMAERTDICSYLALFAMLMDGEEDVHTLRAKCFLRAEMTDKQVLDFFGSIVEKIPPGSQYFRTLAAIEDCKRRRRFRIMVHKFVSENSKAIAAVLSIVGVLVGIFKTLFSLKQH